MENLLKNVNSLKLRYWYVILSVSLISIIPKYIWELGNYSMIFDMIMVISLSLLSLLKEMQDNNVPLFDLSYPEINTKEGSTNLLDTDSNIKYVKSGTHYVSVNIPKNLSLTIRVPSGVGAGQSLTVSTINCLSCDIIDGFVYRSNIVSGRMHFPLNVSDIPYNIELYDETDKNDIKLIRTVKIIPTKKNLDN